MTKLNKYEPNSLVFYEARKNDVFTTSKDIAIGAGISHKKLKETIRKHEKRLRHFGFISARYGTEIKTGETRGRKETLYDLKTNRLAIPLALADG